MKSHNGLLTTLLILFLTAGTTEAISQEDAKGCKDHPLFTRMPNYFIHHCEGSEFDRFEFSSEKGPIAVEGKMTSLYYYLKNGAKGPSMLAILRNYVNAVKKIGGTVVYESGSRATLKVARGTQETWVGIDIPGISEYRVHIVEKGEMKQDVASTAEGMTSEIAATGHTAMYGIYFDTGKSDMKPESVPSLKEVVRMLQQNSSMKLFVVGHTDNMGGIGGNMSLSKARAESVVKELTTKFGVDVGRLASFGVGSLAPVAPNATDEGRALNRRVELVAQ